MTVFAFFTYLLTYDEGSRRRSVAHRRRARGAEHRAPGEAFNLMTQADLVCGGWR